MTDDDLIEDLDDYLAHLEVEVDEAVRREVPLAHAEAMVEAHTALLGFDAPVTMTTCGLVGVLVALLADRVRVLGELDRAVAASHRMLATCRLAMGDTRVAILELDALALHLATVLGPSSPDALAAQVELAEYLLDLGCDTHAHVTDLVGGAAALEDGHRLRRRIEALGARLSGGVAGAAQECQGAAC